MFNIGDRIVYPMHGAGIIEAIEEKEILGEKRKYYIMKMPLGNMKVMIPMNNVEDIGIREIISVEDMDRVIDILRNNEENKALNWNRRYRANLDKIKSGDIYEVAEVVRALTLRDQEKGLSTGEKKMLSSAKQILISELVLVKDVNEEEAEDLIQNLITF